jgi:uncharacterized membrane protein
MGRLFKFAAACLVATYPLIVLFGLQRFPLHYIGFFLIGLALLRLFILRGEDGQQLLNILLSVILILIVFYVLFSGQADWFRFYPVAVNSVMLCVFGYSLLRGMPIVERLARVTDPDLPVQAVPYVRKVTIMWCVFFLLNGVAALYTALWTSFEVWAWYNGALAYVLMALVFAVEWLVRARVRSKISA